MILIVPSTIEHVHELQKDLRDGEKKEIQAFGTTPEEGLAYSFRVGDFKKTALVDGKVAAMWGLQGSLLGQVGHPYFLTGHQALKVSPLRFTKIYLSQLNEMKKRYPVLENYVDVDYQGAVRLLRIAGFDLELFHFNGHDFYKFSMVN